MPRHIVRNFGTSLSFNGASSGVLTTLWSATNHDITISCWAKWRRTTTTRQPLFVNGTGIQTGGPYKGYALIINGNGSTDGSLYILNENVAWISCGYKVTDRNWHQYTLVLDASGFPLVYVDDVLVYNPGSGSVDVPTNTRSTIGNDDAEAFTGWFNGLIDELRVYASALTTAQVSDLFYGRYTSSLPINQYKFDEGSGTTATDSGSSPKNGTITNGTYSTDVFMTSRSLVT